MPALLLLVELGYNIAATPGTAIFYSSHGITVRTLAKPQDESEIDDNTISWIRDRKVDLVINIPEGSTRGDEVTSGYLIRRAAVDFGASLLTNIKCAVLFCEALHRCQKLPCMSSEEYISQPQIGWTK